MPYLIKNDFRRVITVADFEGLIDSDDNVWQDAELSAVEEVKSYLRHRYDVAAEFDKEEHDSTLTYEEGDVVIVTTGSNQGVYVALQDVPTSTLITDAAFWKLSDPRNSKMVTATVLIVLYENYTRLNGSEIPNWLQLRYDGGDVKQLGGIMGYLKAVQKGTVEPDLVLKSDVADGTSQTGNRVAFGNASTVVTRNSVI